MIQDETIHGYRLSPQQRQLWVQLQSAAIPYQARCVLTIEGAAGEAAMPLAAALAAVVGRHEILRTRFVCSRGMANPLQVVEASAAAEFEERREPAAAGDEGRAVDALFAEPEGTTSLAVFPPLRAVLVTLSPARHLLSLTLPTLCADAVTLHNLVGELAAALGGTAGPGGSAAEAGDGPLQYADVSEWLNELLEAEDRELGREYWRQQSAGSAAELGSGRAAAPGPLASCVVPVPAAVSRAARDLAADLPLSALLLAAWYALAARLGDEPDVVIGAASDGRSYAELKSVLGPLAKHVPLKVACAPSLPFRDLVGKVAASLQEAATWQRYYVRASPEETYLARCFEHEERPEPWVAGGLRLAIVRQGVSFDRFDVKLACVRQGESLWSEWWYDETRFERPAVERLAERWLTLLEDGLAHPERPLEELAILSEAERRQLASWNGPRSAYDRERLLPRWIAEQDAGSPAIECAGRRLSYGELNARANQVAHRLRSLGAGAESRVALSAPRSLELLVGMLGILKAGAAYVPLDPGYPVERLAYMLEDSGAELVLAVRPVAERLPSSPAQVLWLDEAAEWAGMSAAEPELALDPAQAAYLIYTSGSTGQPKGVAVSHANLLHSTAARWSHYGDRVEGFLLVSSLSFDSSVAGLFWTLSQGGMVCLPAEGGQRDALALAERVGAGGITHLLCLPSLYAVLLESADRLQSLRVAIVAGEICPPELPERHRERLPAARFFNEYGPTEGTVWSTAWEAPQDGGPLAPVPIGRPIAHVDVWLMDGAGRPAPVGVAGEIQIGGGGVARGYVKRPALTAERFVPDGLSGEAGARLYRTGDRGRWSADGVLSFLGRADRQVKLRGYRIELGEVESALRSHAAVGEAAVVLRDGVQGPRLVGYWSPSPEPQPAAPEAELRVWMQQRLPDYMVPSALVEVAEWPRTPNGKLDEQALPAPEEGGAGGAIQPARSGVEEVVAAVWADVLGREEEPGREDNFFDLGGHSLLATQVVSRLRAAFEVDLTLPMLFAAPTVARLAACVEQMRPGSAAAAPPLVAGVRPEPLPLSHSQQRLWFLDQLHPGSAFYNINTAVRLEGALSVGALAQALQEMVERHEALRTRFPVRGGQPVQEVGAADPEAAAAVEQVDLAEWPAEDREAEARRRLAAAARRPFDLACGPLMRALLVRLAPEDHLLLLTLHHIISDAWSMGVLVRELTTLYTAFCDARPSPLPPLPIQYADFACWQRGWLQGEVLEAQLDYWRRQLAGASVLLELPTDRARPAVERFQGAKHGFELPASLLAAIHHLARREESTPFMLLLAGFQVLLHRYTAQDDLSVGTPIANRDLLATENVIGFFTNTLVIRSDLGGDTAFRGLLSRVRKTTLEAYEHQALPFDRLVEELQPARSLSHTPLFQAMLVWQKTGVPDLQIPGLKLTALSRESSTSKFDLTLFLTEAGSTFQGAIEYNSDLFDAATIARVAGHLQTLIEAIVAAPDEPISILPLMPAAEREQLVVQWNATGTSYSRDIPVHALFERQAARTGDGVALVCGADHLTYAELEAAANRLARRLRGLGVVPDMPVAICMERSPEMFIAVLGVLKVGGAYVPLDPSYPAERLRFMLADSGATVLLSRPGTPLPPSTARRVELARGGAAATGADTRELPGEPAIPVTPDHLAYVIYTSGSTGRPKGVALPHRPLVNLVEWHRDALVVKPRPRMLQFSSLSFDVSAAEAFIAWSLGGTLLVVSEETRHDITALARFILEDEVETMFLPFVALQQLADELRRTGGYPQSLRELFSTAEPLQVTDSVAELFARLPGCTLCNEYGPSETHVLTTYTASGPAGSWPPLPPIGKPIANSQAYVVDRHFQPVPAGVPRDLYLGGDNLARGYLGRPELTAERFVPNPFSAEPGTRLYRTGDLASYLPDGNLRFLGRSDQQVKIRGFRIEPGEIETVLKLHPAIQDAIVVTQEHAAGQRQLAAYVVAAGADEVSGAELRRHLRQHVPGYMVPTVVVTLPALPTTPSGKVDRRALAERQAVDAGAAPDGISPRTAAERVVAGIWSSVLQREPIGVEDNFFDLGGHSLQATQIILRLRAEFPVEQLPLRRMFEAPTVVGLVAALAAELGGEQVVEAVAEALLEIESMRPEEVDELLLQGG